MYGAKKWYAFPPHLKIMSNKHILDFIETDLEVFINRGVKPITCVQQAGDVLIIPESWGHGVLNVQDSIVMATEITHPLFRPFPGRVTTKFPAGEPRPRKSRRSAQKGRVEAKREEKDDDQREMHRKPHNRETKRNNND
jgi:hypothetical protein